MSGSPSRDTPRIDEANQCIWRDDQRIDLVPKAFLVLRCLMRRPNQIVSKNELLEAGWPDTHVMDGVLKVAINQLRDALGDDSQQPRFIETVHRRGYRWVGPAIAPTPATPPPPTAPLGPVAPELVGRESALEQLGLSLARAASGVRQTVFVTGDPGIGKTTTLDAFVAQLGGAGSTDAVLVAQGQCADGYGTSDAYMPLLQAVAQLCREANTGDTVALLRRFAPTWLVQIPQLLDAAEQEELRRSLAGSTGERMVRDLLFFIEELTAHRTLVLLLEDVHWSDHATIAALAALAGGRTPARLMIVASYRAVDAIAQMHPVTRLKQELASRRQCHEIVLDGLDLPAVEAFLSNRFPDHRLVAGFAAVLHEQTSGNPLFILNAVEELIRRGRLRERDGAWECTVDLATLADAVPDSTGDMIGARLEQLSAPDLELLEAASVVGPIFPTQALAAMLAREPATVETDCGRLARSTSFLREGETVDWVDGRTGVQHFFRHALYRQVLYGRVTPARRQLLHLRFAECLEKGFGKEATTLTSQLAHHFEQGRDLLRAVKSRRRSARRASDRFAYRQAIEHLRAGLAILLRLPASEERDGLELALQADLIAPMYADFGSSSGALTLVIERIHALSKGSEAFAPERFRALATMVSAQCSRGEMHAARALSEQLVEGAPGELGATVAGGVRGFCQLVQGELEAGTLALERSSELPTMPAPLDPGIAATADVALGHVMLGRPVRARDFFARAVARAESSKHPATIAHVAACGVRVGTLLLEDGIVEKSVATLVGRSTRLSDVWFTWSHMGEGWLELRRGNVQGAETIREARRRRLETATRGYQSQFAAMAATGFLDAGRYDEAGALLDEGLALIADTGECWCEAELHRLKGELTLARVGSKRTAQVAEDAEACFVRALEIARTQGAKWWTLRAAGSLARLLDGGDRREEALRLLKESYDGFDEGLDLPDLRAARDLLQALGD